MASKISKLKTGSTKAPLRLKKPVQVKPKKGKKVPDLKPKKGPVVETEGSLKSEKKGREEKLSSHSVNAMRRWAVTWANCELSKERVRDLLFKKHRVREYVVSREVAPSTGKGHVHAYVRLVEKFRWKSDLFNLAGDVKNGEQEVYQANVVPALDWRGWVDYVIKQGDFLTNMAGIDPKVSRAKKWKTLISLDPVRLAEQGEISWKEVQSLMNLQETLTLLQREELKVFHKTIWEEGKQHHFYIVDSRDVGKTSLLNEIEQKFMNLEKEFDLPSGRLVFKWSRNRDQKGYRGAPLII